MSLLITKKCIACDMCEPACPNQAIYMSDDTYHIDPYKCTECLGFYDKPNCIEVCPIDCIIKPIEKIEKKRKEKNNKKL